MAFFRHGVSYRDRFKEGAKLMLTGRYVNLKGACSAVCVSLQCALSMLFRHSLRGDEKIVINSLRTYTSARH